MTLVMQGRPLIWPGKKVYHARTDLHYMFPFLESLLIHQYSGNCVLVVLV